MARTLTDLEVRDVMVADPPTIHGRMGLREATRRMSDSGAECLLVLADDSAPMGFLSERELVFGAEAESQGHPGHAGEYACAAFIAARPEERFVDLLDRMGEAAVKRAVVLDARGALLGLVSIAGGMVLDFLDPPEAEAPLQSVSF